MIKPHKYLDISNSLLSIGAEVLKLLSSEKVMRIHDLEIALKDSKGEKGLNLLLPTLNLLYAFGKIEYHQKIDSIELLK